MRKFVAGAGTIASIQEHILDALDETFPEDQDRAAIEAAVLASGYENWESRAINILKSNTSEAHAKLTQHIAQLSARFRQPVAHPGQDPEPFISPQANPHLRVYFCLRCALRMTSMALSGLCCFGQPRCQRCGFEIHEKNCNGRKRKPAATKETP